MAADDSLGDKSDEINLNSAPQEPPAPTIAQRVAYVRGDSEPRVPPGSEPSAAQTAAPPHDSADPDAQAASPLAETLDRSPSDTSLPAARGSLVQPSRETDFGDYELIQEIARGGMGVVFKARQKRLNRTVALKMILAGEFAGADEVQRFHTEAEAAAHLQHSGIVPIYEVGEHQGRHFFSMGYVEGDTLASLIAAGPIDGREAARLVAQVADAIAYAHGHGVIHRDLKPGNILLEADGQPRVTDFGLAKRTDMDSGLTGTGQILGTPSYMAPEQAAAQSDQIGPRSDVYALGAILYYLITGRPPFQAANVMDTLLQVMNQEPVAPRQLNPAVDRDLETICLKCLQKQPAARYSSAKALQEELDRVLHHEPILARPISTTARAWRWCRRNPGLSISLGAVAALLLVINIVGPLLTLRMSRLNSELQESAHDLERARTDAERKAADNLRLAEETEAARRNSVTMLADMQTERGILAGEDAHYATAALWFASAAQLTPHDPDRQAANWLRARNWLNEAMVPVALLKLPNGSNARMAFHPDGQFLLTWNTSGLRIWDWRREQPLPWTESLSGVTDASWSPDGQQVAVGFGSGAVQLFGVPSGKLLRSIQHADSIATVLWSQAGQRVAVATGTRVQVWNVAAEPRLEHDWPHPRRVYGLRFNQAGDRMATACDDGLARLFAVGGHQGVPAPLLAPVQHGTHRQAAPVFYDADRQFVTSAANQLRWWNVNSGDEGTPENQIEGDTENVNLTASSDGRWVVAAKATGETCALWNVDGGDYVLDCNNTINNLVFDSSGRRLLMCGFEEIAKLWSLPPSGGLPLTAPRFDTRFSTCALSSDDQFAAIGGDTQVVIWRLPPDNVVVADSIDAWNGGRVLPAVRPRIGFDGQLATQGVWHNGLYGHPSSNELTVVKLVDGQPAGPTISLEGPLTDSCLCANPRLVAAGWVAGTSGALSIYNLATGEAVFPSIALPDRPISVAARPVQSQVAVLCQAGQLLVIDTDDGRQLLELAHEGWGKVQKWAHVEYSPDGSALVAVTPSNQVFVRQAATGELRFPPLNPATEGGPCRHLAISADSRLLATAVNNVDVVQVWDLQTGHPVGCTLPHPNGHWGIFSVDFSPDGSQILTAHVDGRLRLWDWKSGKLLVPPMQHTGEVYDGRIIADGRYALAAVRGGTVQIWDLKTGKLAATPIKYRQPWGYSKHPSTYVLGIAGSHVIATGAGYSTLLDVSTLIERPQASLESLRWLAELSANQTLQLGELTKFQDAEWRERWDVFQKTHPTVDPVFAHVVQQIRVWGDW